MAGSLWLLIAVLLLAASIILHQVPLLLISLLFFLSGGIARLWGQNCLKRVEYHRRLSANRAFFGDEVRLETEVVNRKPLPLPWLQIDDNLPDEVTLLRGSVSPSYNPGFVLLSNTLSMSWYYRVRKRYRLQCRQRGYFTFGPAHLRSGDIFGLFSRESEVRDIDELIVYPRVLPLQTPGIPSNQPQGDIRTRSHLFQDPVLTLGVRDYHPGDSLKRIHWKATARLGELQTRVFEPTTTVDMGIFLDVRTVPMPLWGSEPQLMELAIITAASIAKQALDEDYRVGLYVNQNWRTSNQVIRSPPGARPDQFKAILEALAPLQSFETMPLARLIMNENRNLHWGSTITAITAVPSEELLATLLQLQRAGRKVVLVVVGGKGEPVPQYGLTTYLVRNDISWEEIDRVVLETNAR